MLKQIKPNPNSRRLMVLTWKKDAFFYKCLKKVKVESVKSITVDPATIFNSLEESRKSNKLAEKITSAAVYFEASRRQPGLLDKVNTATGERQIGRFCNGEFKI